MALREYKNTLTVSAHLKSLGDVSENLSRAPGLTDAERIHLAQTKLHTLAISLRNEHPVMHRLAGLIEGKPGSLSEPEWNTLALLIGPSMSRVEREFLDSLRKTGRFDDEFLKTTVEPHRTQLGQQRNKMATRAGAVRVGQNVAAGGAQLGVLVGGILVFPPLLALNVVYALFGMRKVNSAIEDQYNRAVSGHGVNAVAGGEVIDESRIALAEVAATDIWHARSVQDLTALGQKQLGILQTLGNIKGPTPNDGPMVEVMQAVDAYTSQLKGMLEAHEANPKSLKDLKGEMYELMANALEPSVLLAAMQATLESGFGAVGGQQDANFAEAQAQLFEVAKAAFATDAFEGPEDEVFLQEHAEYYLRAVTLQAALGDDDKAVDPTLVAFFQAAVENPRDAAESKAGKALQKNMAKVEEKVKTVQREGTRTRITEKTARNLGDAVAKDFAEVVLPRFVPGAEDTVSPAGGSVRKVDDGFLYTCEIQGGLFGGRGDFSVKLHKDGSLDPSSLKVSVGKKNAKAILQATVEALDARNQISGLKDSGNGYEAKLNTAAKSGQIRLAPFGAPDLRDIAKLMT